MIDLHTHTCHSDGADTAEELLKKAQELGIGVLSVTDHNTVSAYRTDAIRNYPGRLIPGVEITCMYQGEVVEVLGYGFCLEQMEEELKNHVLTFREKQLREYELFCDTFNGIGIRYEPGEILFNPDRESCRKAFLKNLKKYPENRRFFRSKEGWETSRAFTREEIYNPDSMLYVDESSLYPDLKAAVEMIHRSGGIAFLAHLFLYAGAVSIRKALSEIIKEAGLDGIECAHSEFTAQQTEDLNGFCLEHGLLQCGGSDYHGSRKPGIELGTGRGQLQVPEGYLKGWPEKMIRHVLQL